MKVADNVANLNPHPHVDSGTGKLAQLIELAEEAVK